MPNVAEIGLSALARTALAVDGFAVLDGRDSEEAALRLVDGRIGLSELLIPRAKGEGWSLSDRFGMSAFPWHTDGAVSRRPPRWVMLTAESDAEGTGTDLLRPSAQLLQSMRRSVLSICDPNGRKRVSLACTGTGSEQRVVWDPRIAVSSDPALANAIHSTESTATVNWRAHRTLVLDNWRLLHRRPDVKGHITRTLRRTYVWER
jgi:hypothetical protein